MDETKLIEEVKRIIATGTRGPSPSIVPKFIDALFDAENKTISASALVRQLYLKEWAKANAKGNDVKFQLRKTNSLEKVRRLINNRLFNTPYLFQMFITLFRRKFGILTQPEPIFEKRLAELEQLSKRTPKKKGKKTKKEELKQEKQIPHLREELERRWDEFQKRTTILDLLAVIEQDVNKIRSFHSHEEVPIQDQYIPVQVTLEKQSTHELETFYSYSEPEDESKRAHSFRGFSDSSAQSQISWEEARTRYDKIMVLADPGMGKSTLLRMTCLQIATLEKQKLKTDSGSDAPQDAIIPLLLKLDALAASDLEILECVCDIARKEYPKLSERTTKMLRRNLEEGKCVLLLDALDEVRLERLKNLSERLTRFSKNYKCRVICSSRIVGYPGRFLDNSMQVEIVPFDLEQKREYIQAWFKNSKGTIKTKNATAEGLLKELDDKPQVSGLARIPLLLSLICSLCAYGKISLPARRVEIYQQAVDFMLGEWSQTRRSRPKPWIVPKKLLLEKIAYMFSCEGRERFPERDLSQAIDTIRKDLPMVSDLRKTTTVDLIQELSRDDGILTTEESKEGTNYLFLHRTFQEYFAASYINQVMKEDLAAGLKLAQNHFWHLEWHETISLLAGLMDNPIPLLDAIVSDQKDDIFHTMLELAGKCIIECKQISDPTCGEIIEELTAFSIQNEIEFLNETLATLGRSYDQICDSLICEFKKSAGWFHHHLAEILVYIGTDRVVELLSQCLKEQHPSIRSEAAKLLGLIKGERAIDPLIDALNDPGEEVGYDAAIALGEIRTELALKPLIDALKYSSAQIREGAAEALGNIKNILAIEPLIDALKTADVKTKSAAARALGKIGTELVIHPLSEAQKDPHPMVRLQARLALIRTRPEDAADFFAGALRDPEPSVGKGAVFYLANLDLLNSQKTAQLFVPALTDSSDQIREMAAYALGNMKSLLAVKPLICAINDPNENVRYHATWALGKIGGELAIETLMGIIYSSDVATRQGATMALGELTTEPTFAPLFNALKDPDEEVRHAAARGLGKIEVGGVLEQVLDALRDPSGKIKKEAAWALADCRWIRFSQQVVDAIVHFLKVYAGMPRLYALAALSRMRKPEVLNVIIKEPDIDFYDSAMFEVARALARLSMRKKGSCIRIYPEMIQCARSRVIMGKEGFPKRH